MKEMRPWGWYEVLADEAGYKVKVIHVEPGQRLSLQSHRFRQEKWTLLSGVADVTIDEYDHQMKVPGLSSIFIPPGARHRLTNAGTAPTEVLELQTGTYFGEDDIVRYDDDYGRESASNQSSAKG